MKHFLTHIFLLACFQVAWAQSMEESCQQGIDRLAQGDYVAALSEFTLCEMQGGKGALISSGMGICHFELGDLEQAEKKLFEAIQSSKKPPPDAWRYLGKAHHERTQFEKAISYYKRFLKEAASSNAFRAAVKDDIFRCANGLHIRRQKELGVVVNLGAPLNSSNDEFSPTLLPNRDDRLYFAKAKQSEERTQVRSDIYLSELKSGDWTPAQPLSFFLNSVNHEIPLAFDEKGESIYFFRGESLFSGDILKDTLRQNNLEGTLFIADFKSPIKAWEGDRDLFFFSDSVLLFASRRPGGYGGFDLYVATLRPDGWSATKNLGPTINSAYDETSPFLAKDGRTLYFSTNDAQRSLGGLDMMRSVFLDRVQKWIPAENLGIGFNSAGDDEGFTLNHDGSRAFFSSSRKQGLGQRDLYVGIFEKTKTNELQPSEPSVFYFVRPPENIPPPVAPAPVASALKLSALQYPEPNMPLTESSFSKLKEVATWMKKYPDLRVTFAAHAAIGDNRNVSQSALQQVVEALQAEGVNLENIALRNAGSTFPLSENEALNVRRVDVIFANPEILPVGVELQELNSSRALFFQRAMGRLVYQVKIPVDENNSAATLFQNYPDGNLLTYPVSGQTNFIHGIYLTWNSAREAQLELVQNGFTQAEAVPFLRSWELSREEAKILVNDYPKLSEFINQ